MKEYINCNLALVFGRESVHYWCMDIAIDIFAYSNVRHFMRDYYDLRHQANRNFSHRYLAKALGEKSPSFLQKFIDNERRLNPHQVETIVRIFNMAEHEAKYFRVLYLYSTATTRTEQELYLDQLVSLNHTPRRELSSDLREYYSHWYNPVIRSVLSVVKMGNDFKKIASMIHPKVTARQVQSAVQLLAKLKLIAWSDEGFWVPSDEGLFTKDSFHDAFVQGYRQQCLDLASQLLASQTKSNPMHFSTAAMSVSESAHQRILRKLDKFRSDIRSIVRKDDQVPRKVIQFQIQAFQLMEIDA